MIQRGKAKWVYEGLDIIWTWGNQRRYEISAERQKTYDWTVKYFPGIEYPDAAAAMKAAEAFDQEFERFANGDLANELHALRQMFLEIERNGYVSDGARKILSRIESQIADLAFRLEKK